MDLVIRGGYVIDPSQELEGTMDVEIARGRVRRVAPHIEPEGRQTLNARGKIVTPGLVDLHCHFYEGFTHYGVNLDRDALARRDDGGRYGQRRRADVSHFRSVSGEGPPSAARVSQHLRGGY